MFGLTDKIISYVAGGIAVACLAWGLWTRADLAITRHNLTSTQASLDKTTQKLDASEGQRREMIGHVQLQNEAVERMHERAINNKLKVEHLLSLWETGNRERRTQIDALQKRIKGSKETSCQVAIKEIREMLQ